MKPIETAKPHYGLVFLLVFLLFVAGIVATGWLYYRNYTQHYRAEVERQLSIVADLKMSELTQWRKERMGDGGILFKNIAFGALVRHFLENPEDADAQRQLLDWMGKLSQFCQYDRVWLLDTQNVARLAVPGGQQPSASATLQQASEALRSGQALFQDFYRNEHDQRVYLAVMVPILDEPDASRPLGVLVLRIDPAAYLYPFIKRWPTPSRTAETLLVRREGSEAVFLNELRFQTNTALNLHAPLDRVSMPAVQAVLGREGVTEGIDYRGIPVVAALRTIPDSPWSLVARMDTTEAYAPLRERLWQVGVMICVLLFGVGASVWLVWWKQRGRFYIEKDNLVRASELRYRRLFEAARDGVLILDAETGQVVDVNPFMLELLGVTREAFLGKKVWELGFFQDLVANEANFVELKAKEYIRYEDMALEGHDGKRHEVEFVSNVYLVDGKKVIQCNIRDITARKLAEAVLVETKALLQASLDHSQAGIAIADAPSGKLRYVNQAGLLIGGGTEAELVAGLDVNQYVASWNLFNLDGTPLAQEEVPLARAVLFGEQCTREFIIRRSELDDRIVLAAATPIRNQAGEVTAGIVVFLDITERKRGEELLLQNAQELRARNEELTRFNRLMAGRELHVIELKQQVNDLAAQLGQPRPYPLAFLDATAAEVVRTTPKPDEQGAEVSKTQKEKSP